MVTLEEFYKKHEKQRIEGEERKRTEQLSVNEIIKK